MPKLSSLSPYRLEQINFFELQSPLLPFSRNVTSQNGEDGIIQRIFELSSPSNQFCAEFGAWDGKYLSNCWNLVSNFSWQGCFIEANTKKFADLLSTHGANEKVRCVNRFVEFEGQNSLDNILASVNAPKDLDLLSIDVDGTDYFIWESLKHHRPNVVVIEFNPTIPNDVIFVQPKTNSVNQGCSLLALVSLGKEKGYELICCTGCNAFFAKAELYPKFGIPNNFIAALYRPLCDGRIFHGYDSYVYVVGMPRLVWSGISLAQDDFQVVPASIRKFADSQIE